MQNWGYENFDEGDAWACSNEPQCFEFSASTRVFFAASIFFVAMALVGFYLPSSHEQFWLFKVFFFMGLFIAFLFVDHDATTGFAWVARIGYV